MFSAEEGFLGGGCVVGVVAVVEGEGFGVVHGVSMGLGSGVWCSA